VVWSHRKKNQADGRQKAWRCIEKVARVRIGQKKRDEGEDMTSFKAVRGWVSRQFTHRKIVYLKESIDLSSLSGHTSRTGRPPWKTGSPFGIRRQHPVIAHQKLLRIGEVAISENGVNFAAHPV